MEQRSKGDCKRLERRKLGEGLGMRRYEGLRRIRITEEGMRWRSGGIKWI